MQLPVETLCMAQIPFFLLPWVQNLSGKGEKVRQTVFIRVGRWKRALSKGAALGGVYEVFDFIKFYEIK